MILKLKFSFPTEQKGGPGSGHHGHSGRPGQRGGSAPGSGIKGDYSKWDMAWFKASGSEMIPVSVLLDAIEYNRLDAPFTSNIRNLADDIKANGLQDTLILDWSAANNKIFIGEGNHRIQALKLLGYSHAPARVVKSSWPNEKGITVTGMEPDWSGYVPSTPKPSQIGVPGALPIDKFT